MVQYLGETYKSPINNAELQRIGLRTLETYIIEENIVRSGCSFRYINCIDGRLGPRMTCIICPMTKQFLIYKSYCWYKYLGETDKSPINNAELQRIVLGTLDQSTTPRCKGSFLVHQICLFIVLKNTNMGVSEERGKSNIIREVDYRAPKARVRGVGDAYSRTARDDAAKPLVLNKTPISYLKFLNNLFFSSL